MQDLFPMMHAAVESCYRQFLRDALYRIVPDEQALIEQAIIELVRGILQGFTECVITRSFNLSPSSISYDTFRTHACR